MNKIQEICHSYESGYGHGYANDGFDLSKTPHSDKELGEAYQIGYEAGQASYAKESPILKIDWSFDDYQCELCGTSWSTGARVTLGDAVILDAPAVAHCQGSVNVEEGHILYHLCKHLGIEVEGLGIDANNLLTRED